MLKNLYKKVKSQADVAESGEKKADVCDKELRKLIKKHGVQASEDLVKDLLSWKLEQ